MDDRRSKSTVGRRAALVAVTCVVLFAVCQGIVLYFRSMVRNPDMAVGFAMNPLLLLAAFLRFPFGIGAALGAVLWCVVRLWPASKRRP